MKRTCLLVIAFSLIFSTSVIAGQERPLVMDGGRIKKMAPTDQVDYRNVPTDETTLERDPSGKNVRVKDDGISDAKIDWGSAAEKVNADDMPDGPAKIIPTSTQETNWDNHLSDTSNPHSVTKDQVGLTNVEDLKVKLDATAAPTVNDDTDLGYAPGSRWVDVTNDKEYVCLDNTDGAAVWIETTQSGNGGPLDKHDGTQAPTANEDSDDGYSVGSHWEDVTNDKAYICLDATVANAVWTETTAGAAGGEQNTASNQGVGGVGLYHSKVGVDLQFKNINAGSAKITVTNDAGDKEVDIDLSDARADADGDFETIVLTAEGAVVGSDIVKQVVGGSGVIKQYEIEFQDGDYGDDAEAFWSFVMPDNYSATFNSGNCKITIWYYNEGTPPAEVTFAIGWKTWGDDQSNPASTDVVDWNTEIDDTAGTQNLVQKVVEANFDPDWVAGDMVTFGLKRIQDTEDDTINFLRLKIEYPVDHVFSGN